MDGKLKRILRTWWLPLAYRAARAYVAGPELSDALRECQLLANNGYPNIISFWSVEHDEPSQVAEQCLASLDTIAKEKLDCYISLKAPALGFSRDLMNQILTRARLGGIAAHFDSLGPETAEKTLPLITEASSRHPQIGCTLPGRWRRSPNDADWAVRLGLRVRVVKGHWGDPGRPKMDPRKGFLEVIDRLAGRARHVSVATHDYWLARQALKRLRAAGTPCDLELLFGLPVRKPIQEAQAAGVPVRFYIAYGHGSLPRRLSEAPRDPRVLWWIFLNILSGRSSFLNGVPNQVWSHSPSFSANRFTDSRQERLSTSIRGQK